MERSFYNRHSKYDPVGEDMKREFYPKLSPVKILAFYIKHPVRLWQKLWSLQRVLMPLKHQAPEFCKGSV